MLIDKLSYQSKLRWINAGEKAILAVTTLFLCVGSRSILLGIFVFVTMGFFTVKGGGIPLRQYLYILTIPLLFLIVNAIILGISIRETPLELFALPVGRMYLTASRETCQYGCQIFITAMGAVSCLYFLSCSTPVADLLTLLRQLHCPALIVELMLLIYRFLFVLSDGAKAISIAQNARLGNKDLRTAVHSFGALLSQLFVHSIRRSSMLFDAMESRCYTGEIRVLSEKYPVKKFEIFLIVGYLIVLGIILWIETKRGLI